MSGVADIRRRARQHIQDGAVTPSYGADRDTVLRLLNEALATELVCVLRYKRHYYMAGGAVAEAIRTKLLQHANEEQAHADRIAERIVELGGAPNFNPDGLGCSAAIRSTSKVKTLADMLAEDLIAERIAIESYREIIQYLGNKDARTRRLFESILAVEEEHAEELRRMREGMLPPGARGSATAPTERMPWTESRSAARTVDSEQRAPRVDTALRDVGRRHDSKTLCESAERTAVEGSNRLAASAAVCGRCARRPLVERGGRLIAHRVATLAWIAAIWFVSWAKGISHPVELRAVSRRVPHAGGALAATLGIALCVGRGLCDAGAVWMIALLLDRTRGDISNCSTRCRPATRYLRHEIDRNMNDPGSLTHRLKTLVDLPRRRERPA